jgi:anti-sigma factor RsiW
MTMSTEHDRITERLSEFLDGELDARERAEVEQHLASCAACRQIAGELRAVMARAATLPDAPPAQDLWVGIASRIDDSRVVRFEPRRRFSFTLPQLAAAGIALMVLSGGMVWLTTIGNPQADVPAVAADAPRVDIAPVSLADPAFEGAVEDLEQILDQNRARLDPATVRILEQNLESIDTAIEQSRQALERDPANTFLNNHLASARQRKLALLRRATALTAGS